MASSLLGGVINAFIPTAKTAPAMASGFGWKILFPVFAGRSRLGPVIGSAAFLTIRARASSSHYVYSRFVAAAVQRRWACAERPQWTLRCRYYSARRRRDWFLGRLSYMALSSACWSPSNGVLLGLIPLLAASAAKMVLNQSLAQVMA